MDFNDRPEDAAFRREVRQWLEHNAQRQPGNGFPPPSYFAQDEHGDLAWARGMQARLADAGLAGITWAQEYGGRGASVLQQAIFDDESQPYRMPTTRFSVGTGIAGPAIIAHGTDAQRAQHLRPILRGEEVWCQLFSEPEAGSDLAGLRTRAERDGEGWVLSGEKVWSSGAHYADWGIMPARTGEAASRHRGITFFLVPMQLPGITIRPLRQMTGDSHFNQVVFDGVRVEDDAVLGGVNEGWTVVATTLANERAYHSAGDVGVDPAHVLQFARQATIDGRPATMHPVIRQGLSDLYARGQVLRFLRYRSLTALGNGGDPGPEVSVGKLAVAELFCRSSQLALHLQGATGMTAGDPGTIDAAWQAQFLAAPAARIGGGTDEIQRNIIAERVLGLPR